ncbi:MAG: AbrB/MazE/SpoVT family DNA-binding domain-containing protein [Archaeoglobaceae archaeon]|nr:AbrB/MazE/SpoVT family DNA-binding domain-containing protein [Archaeoglobaceae archaeon]MDW8128160.1 PhoU domain-containing protein [Archaeoglobaceae archaeon]
MEPRKIFKSGKGSYILTLPKDWVQKNGLKDGDHIYLEISDDRITIFPREAGKKEKFLDLESLSFDRVLRRIIAHYLANYDVLRVKVNTEEQRRAIAFASDMLIGMEIMEDTGDEMELMAHLDPSKINLEEMIERISRVCLSMLEDFIKLSSQKFDKKIASSIAFRESEVDRLYLLILRLSGDARFFRSFVRHVERIADHIENMTEAILKLEKSYRELSAISEVYEIAKSSMIAFMKYDIEIAEEVLDKIANLKKDFLKLQEELLKYPKEEMIYLKTILDSTNRILAYSADIAEATIDRSVMG